MKLIAVDLDGTLLTSTNEISDFTRDTLIEASKACHKVVIITGRDFYASKYLGDELEFEKYDGLIASSNGANVFAPKENRSIINHQIDQDLAKEMMAFGKSLGFDVLIYHKGEILTEKKNAYSLDFLAKKNRMEYRICENLTRSLDFPVNKVLFTALPQTIEKNKEIFAQKFGKVVNPIHAMPQFLDCMPKGINKGRAIGEIADYFGIDQKDTYAFGDEINDLEMIEKAGVGVAMGNATKALKEIADQVTLSNDEDGIAHFVRENILKEK